MDYMKMILSWRLNAMTLKNKKPQSMDISNYKFKNYIDIVVHFI